MMTDDPYARIAQLEAEVAALRQREAALASERDEAREQQTATAEVLRVIASSPTELERVLETIVAAAGHLLDADSITHFEVRDDRLLAVGPYRRDGRYGPLAEQV